MTRGACYASWKLAMIDLSPRNLAIVQRVLRDHVPGCAVRAFGSRAKWTAADYSDLDLAVVGESELGSGTLARLREAFEDSPLPMRVDVLDWHDISPEFRKLIERDCIDVLDTAPLSSWRRTTLGQCASLVRDGVMPASCGDVPYVGLEHIGQGTLSLLGRGSAQDVESAKTAFRAGDILFGKLRPYFRKVIRPRFDGICSTDIWVVRPQADVDAGFLFYLLASSRFVDAASQGADGTRMPRAKWEHVSGFAFRLPPLAEQGAIARILGALDDKIELNRRMAATLEEKVRALFKSWFVDAKEPGGPQHADLNEYASLNPESWSATNRPESVAYVDLANTKWGIIERVEPYEWQDAPSRARRIVRSGDTIVGMVRPGNGSFALIGRDGLTASTGFAVLRPKADFDAQFVWCAATSKENVERLAHLADGGAYPAVSPEAVAATPVAVADAPVRRKFADTTGPMVAKYLAAGEEARALADWRDTLLPKLISGEIRIGNAEKIAEDAA